MRRRGRRRVSVGVFQPTDARTEELFDELALLAGADPGITTSTAQEPEPRDYRGSAELVRRNAARWGDTSNIRRGGQISRRARHGDGRFRRRRSNGWHRSGRRVAARWT